MAQNDKVNLAHGFTRRGVIDHFKVLVGNLSEAVDSRKSMTTSIVTGATASGDEIPHYQSAPIYLVFQLEQVRKSSRFVGD